MTDPTNAFTDRFTLAGAEDGPLVGLSFAAKDLYDVAGYVTRFGSPAWAEGRAPADIHATVVRQMLMAGATLVGKTHTDELAYSLIGKNAHFGTPINPAAPNRVPGGSSSGSASAVAAGVCDLALGSDTGGSVRGPASFCGIYGIRTTHGRLDMAGAMPLAPSFDVCGWFARDADVFAKGGLAFGINAEGWTGKTRLLAADDLFAHVPANVAEALAPVRARVEAATGPAESLSLLTDPPSHWLEVFKTVQAFEAWATHGSWISKATPDFGPGVKERFKAAGRITAERADWGRWERERLTTRLADLLGGGAVVMMPTCPAPAPLLDADDGDLDDFRQRALELHSIAGLARLPQVSIPGGLVDGAPVGLSLLGGPSADAQLLKIVRDLR